ncbi:hypothetical protein BB559_002167 [Furculomyces boomerangus]|uniref:Casein kinase II subunit beta n=2 Tax=Harpellales TaxID=61421 RepID=A0A2T9YXC8_9FUNG|nr:hypothetical protein BB559_002167 [Furculomyces boomerangus]PWA00265.1 hypothetical protein BB558_003686 [Smittium angustum]
MEPEYDDSIYASEESGDEEALSWISWYCSLSGHEFFCEVEEEFIDDDFNLTGLSQMVNYYNEALDIILDIDNEEDEDKLEGSEMAMVEMSADVLYGLIHARYIITRMGLQQMAEKYENGEFGTCPRFLCNFTPVLPCGRTDQPDRDTVKLFCPNCLDIYNPSSAKYHSVDGAFFGTTFPNLFFDTYPELLPKQPSMIYTPKIFGFKISEKSKIGSRVRWLRMQPEDKSILATQKDEEADKNNDNDEGKDGKRNEKPSENQIPDVDIETNDKKDGDKGSRKHEQENNQSRVRGKDIAIEQNSLKSNYSEAKHTQISLPRTPAVVK